MRLGQLCLGFPCVALGGRDCAFSVIPSSKDVLGICMRLAARYKIETWKKYILELVYTSYLLQCYFTERPNMFTTNTKELISLRKISYSTLTDTRVFCMFCRANSNYIACWRICRTIGLSARLYYLNNSTFVWLLNLIRTIIFGPSRGNNSRKQTYE